MLSLIKSLAFPFLTEKNIEISEEKLEQNKIELSG
jgi:hypothetical protein